MRDRLPPAFGGYPLAILATAAAVAVRWLLDPWLGDLLALVTLYAAVAAAVWFGGFRPATLAVVLGYLASDYLFIEPRGRDRRRSRDAGFDDHLVKPVDHAVLMRLLSRLPT